MKYSKEKTLVLIKPDGIQRSLIGEIIKRVERTGLKLVGIKMVIPTELEARNHYLSHKEWLKNVGEKSIASYKKAGKKAPGNDPIKVGEIILDKLIKYITSGPIIALVWQGAHSVSIVKKIVGETEPKASDVGTIRGDFVLDSYEISDTDGRSVRNLVHASGSVEEANNEIGLWFKDNEILNYRLVQEQILYDVNLDGILE